ncbi:hypothetical protein SNEBB_008170 [Seison nebaliae]|nr:hypothetical protein SNEBB_008170 [Seison nebaliae]
MLASNITTYYYNIDDASDNDTGTTTNGSFIPHSTHFNTSHNSLLDKIDIDWFGLVYLTLTCFGAIFGNLLVIVAIATTRRLQTITNVFVSSLAVSDLLLSVLVLPISIIVHIYHEWPFNTVICDLWIAADVMLCTASILNLCCISVDRYMAVTNPLTYSTQQRTKKTAYGMIALVWLLSILITCPPYVFGWQESVRSKKSNTCMYINTKGYVVYSACGSFFVPMIVMLFIYARIFQVADSRERRLHLQEQQKIRQCLNEEQELQQDTYSLSLMNVTNVNNQLKSTQSCYERPLRTKSLGTILSVEEKKSYYHSGNDVHVEKKNQKLSNQCTLLSSKLISRRRTMTLTKRIIKLNRLCRNRTNSNNLSPFRYSTERQRHFHYSDRQRTNISSPSSSANHSPIERHTDILIDDNRKRNSYLDVEQHKSVLDEPIANNPRRLLCSEEDIRKQGKKKKSGKISKVKQSRRKLTARFFPKNFRSSTCSSISSNLPSSRRWTTRRKEVFLLKQSGNHERTRLARERKAAKTLAIVVGGFIACWLPFFTIYIINPFVGNHVFPVRLKEIVNWVGYFNSVLNPIIYTFYSPTFRSAFRRLLTLLCTKARYDHGTDTIDKLLPIFKSVAANHHQHLYNQKQSVVSSIKKKNNNNQLHISPSTPPILSQLFYKFQSISFPHPKQIVHRQNSQTTMEKNEDMKSSNNSTNQTPPKLPRDFYSIEVALSDQCYTTSMASTDMVTDKVDVLIQTDSIDFEQLDYFNYSLSSSIFSSSTPIQSSTSSSSKSTSSSPPSSKHDSIHKKEKNNLLSLKSQRMNNRSNHPISFTLTPNLHVSSVMDSINDLNEKSSIQIPSIPIIFSNGPTNKKKSIIQRHRITDQFNYNYFSPYSPFDGENY